MIFVTVGEQLPFDRLIRTMDEWAAISGQEVIAQVGATRLKPQHIMYEKHFEFNKFKKIFLSAEIIIAHAGMGTILTAIENKKPLILMPRKAELKEHRNDHQFATIKKIINTPNIYVAYKENDLLDLLSNVRNIKHWKHGYVRNGRENLLIEMIKSFVQKQ